MSGTNDIKVMAKVDFPQVAPQTMAKVENPQVAFQTMDDDIIELRRQYPYPPRLQRSDHDVLWVIDPILLAVAEDETIPQTPR